MQSQLNNSVLLTRQESQDSSRKGLFDTVFSIIWIMTRKEKQMAAILNNPKAVRFEDACKVAERLGFVHKGGQGSHRAFMRDGEPVGLNFQNRNGFVPPYQARQLIEMIEKYEE